MKFIVTADIHLKMWPDKIFNDYGHPLKLVETLNVFESICKYAIDNNIENIFIAGDVNDLKGVVHYKSFVLFKKILEKYDSINFYIISGNHDESSKNDILSAIQLLDGPKNVKTIVKDPWLLENILFIPWSNNIQDIIKTYKSNILISHFGINEGMVNSGLSIRSKINIKHLTNFDLVILGHYHLPQNIDNVWYVGNLIQQNFGEAGEEKRFLVVDSDNLNIESVKTDGYRKYYSLEINDENDIDKIIDLSRRLISNNNYVVVKNKTKNNIEYNDIQILNEYTDNSQIRGITTGMSLKDQLIKFLEISNIPTNQHEEYMNMVVSVIGDNE